MAQTGDLVTPRLWGSPWFEKPPLLYWMTAAGTALRLNVDLAGRLPVALLSLAFLVASFVLLREEFGFQTSAISTALLGTCAAWIAFSDFCLTDLPMAVFFSLAVYLSLPLLRDAPRTGHVGWRFLCIGACLGIAALAKGLVPIALALPFAWFLRRYRRMWWLGIVGCLLVAAPWYTAVYLRNGYPFVQEFFLKHHFERLYSASLEHVQPWYYYFPILLGGLFPWTPLFGLLALREPAWDQRRRFLAALVVFGFVFFSATRNKLPGYLLPLIPSLFVLLGAQFETRLVTQISRLWLLGCALLIAVIPLLTIVLPQSLALGRFSVTGMRQCDSDGTVLHCPANSRCFSCQTFLGWSASDPVRCFGRDLSQKCGVSDLGSRGVGARILEKHKNGSRHDLRRLGGAQLGLWPELLSRRSYSTLQQRQIRLRPSIVRTRPASIRPTKVVSTRRAAQFRRRIRINRS